MTDFPLPPAFRNRVTSMRGRVLLLAYLLAGDDDTERISDQAAQDMIAIDLAVRGNRGNRGDALRVTWADLRYLMARTCRRAAEILDSPSPAKE